MDEALKEKILEVIQAHTRRSPIKSGQIKEKLLMDGSATAFGVKFRKIINRLRQEGYPILAQSGPFGGYWYDNNRDEVDKYIKRLEGRAKKIWYAVAGLKAMRDKAISLNLFEEKEVTVG